MKFENHEAFVMWLADQTVKCHPQAAPVKKRLLVISTPRSGSTLFCDLLEKSGVMGQPMEYFYYELMSTLIRLTDRPKFVLTDSMGKNNLSLTHYVSHLELSSSIGGIFSVHLHVNQWLYLKQRKVDVLQLLRPDVIVSVRRRSRLRQAYSFAMSAKYDFWDSRVIDPRPPDASVSKKQILEKLTHLAEWEDFYEANIASHVCREFWFEEFVRRPDRIVPDVAELLGIDLPDDQKPGTALEPTTSRSTEAGCAALCDWLGADLLQGNWRDSRRAAERRTAEQTGQPPAA